MAETRKSEEPHLPAKRKSDDHESRLLKSPKVDAKPEQKNDLNANRIVEASGDDYPSFPKGESGQAEAGVDADEEDVEDYENDDEESNGDVIIDTKGKGILMEEGEDSDDDEDDNSSDGGNESEGDIDLSDDPLTEVDLDNVLPSRTRRLPVQPGVYVVSDIKDNDDDDSEDPDA